MLSDQTINSNYTTGQYRLLTLLSFSCIYFIWGSTFLAIRYAVETIPPLFVASFRHLIAGGLLFGWCWWRGLRPVRQHWFASIVLGVLFFLIGHGTLHWGQRALSSGVTAFLVAIEPIFVAIVLTATRRTRLTPTLLIGLLLGLFGVALFVGADLQGGRSQMLSLFAVLIGTASWSIGMIYSRSAPLHPDDRMAAAMSLLAGAVMLFLTGLVTGGAAELDLALVSMRSLLSLGYLAIAGSLVAYSAYFWLLSRYPPTLVATHTYVNPIVAVVLGWSIAGEVLTTRFLFGGVVVIAAIALVGRATSRQGQAKKILEQRPRPQPKAAASPIN
jgi:drug/metabolite transporter (DMT)-like permease